MKYIIWCGIVHDDMVFVWNLITHLPVAISFIQLSYSHWDCRTALHWAASLGHLKVVKLLLDKGANLDLRDNV